MKKFPVSYKVKLGDAAIYILNRNENMCPQDDKYKNVHSGFVANDKNMHTMLTSVIRKSVKCSILI